MNLILIEPHELVDQYATLRGERAIHIHEVLRARPGNTIRVGLLNGPRGTALIETITPKQVGLCCTWEQEFSQRPAVDLLLALSRPKVMRRLWAQLAALGVGHIALTNAEKVERNYFDTHVIQPATYRPLLIEGLQQAQDTRLPLVSIHKQLKPLIEDQLDELFPKTLRLLADPAATQTIASAVPENFPGRVLLAVGPEGGWNDFERGLFARAGFVAIGLGPRTLRTDTACLALLANAHATLDR